MSEYEELENLDDDDTVLDGEDDDPVLGEDPDDPPGEDTVTGGTDTVSGGSDTITGGSDTDTLTGGEEVATFTPAMTKEEVEAMNRDHLLQTGVMNPVSEEDTEELGRFASVMYRGNTMKGSRIAMREALRDKLKMQDVAFEHSKLYSYAF